MNRGEWNAGWAKPVFDWMAMHQHRLDFAPHSHGIIEDWNRQGVRMIRRVGGITPESPIPNGTILMWMNQELPAGFEWAHEYEGRMAQ